MAGLHARLLFLWLLTTAGVSAAGAEWRDAGGKPFRGEPVEVFGPLALFRTGPVSSRMVPLGALSDEDCLRFHRSIAGRPPRAERWSDAKGLATADLIGRLKRVEDRELLPVDLTSLPEPELLLVFFGRWRSFESFQLLDNVAPFASRISRVFSSRMATVVVTSWQRDMSTRVLPRSRSWLVVDPSQIGGLRVLSRFVPAEEFVVILMTREGVPLIGGPVRSVQDVTAFVDRASAVLWELNPGNPGTWSDRARYLKTVRPVQFAAASAPPVLLSEPLRVDALRDRGVVRLEAEVDIDADGAATAVRWQETSSLPETLRRPLAEALRRNGVFLPAIDRGRPVAGTCGYSLVVPPAPSAQAAADAAWVNGEARREIPLESWLVLKPIRVAEQVFSTVQRVGPDGTVLLSPVTAGDSAAASLRVQRSAFNTDWFAAAGAGSVHPAEGEMQEVDGEKLTWKRQKAVNGTIDLTGTAWLNNYSIGYAWTEFEVPADTDAWIGIGSDDGLKVWCNGQLVIDRWVLRTARLDDDVAALRLKRGKNQLLVKIQNATEAWNFVCRLRTR